MLKIVHYPNPILKQILKPVTTFDNNLLIFIKAMINKLHEEHAIGLAANQVGVDKRIFIMKVNYDEKPYVFINPTLDFSNAKYTSFKEGCLSFPGLIQEKQRYDAVNVTWVDENEIFYEKTFTGLEAICIQHENDHINGITFIDDLSPLKKQFALKKLKKN